MKKITLNEMDEYIGRCPHYVDGSTVEYLAQLDDNGDLVHIGGKRKFSVEITLEDLGLTEDADPDDIADAEGLSNPGYVAALTALIDMIEAPNED